MANQSDANAPKDVVERLVEAFGEEAVRAALPKRQGGRPKGSTSYNDLRALLFFTEARLTGQASSDREAGRMFAHLTGGNSESAIVDRLRTKYRKNKAKLERLIRLLWEAEEAREKAMVTARDAMKEMAEALAGSCPAGHNSLILRDLSGASG